MKTCPTCGTPVGYHFATEGGDYWLCANGHKTEVEEKDKRIRQTMPSDYDYTDYG